MDINISLASDANYAHFLAMTIASICTNASQQDILHFYIIDGGIKKTDKEKINNLKLIKEFTIEYKSIDDCKDINQCPIPKNSHFTKAAYARFFIADLFPSVDKIIYLDVDIIVLGSLSGLMSTDMQGHIIAACPSYATGIQSLYRIGCYGHSYFNSGVLLIDANTWREKRICRQLLDLALALKDKILYVDQDVFNVFFNKNYKKLTHKYNCPPSLYLSYHPDILHFMGSDKFILPESHLMFIYLDKAGYTIQKNNDKRNIKHLVKTHIKNIIKRIILSLSKKHYFCSKLEKIYNFVQNEKKKSSSTRKKKILKDAIEYHFPDLTVKYGPFSGMQYATAENFCSTLFPKLLGSYEREVSFCIEKIIASQPQYIINIGAAEGYYSIGMAKALPESHVIAFEAEPYAQQLCSAMAKRNHVEDRISLHGKITSDETLLKFPNQNTAIICDIEGFEKNILTEKVFKYFSNSFFLIEIHDYISPYTSLCVQQACKSSHSITIIPALEDANKSIIYDYKEISCYSQNIKEAFLAEGRTTPMVWFFCQPKKNPPLV